MWGGCNSSQPSQRPSPWRGRPSQCRSGFRTRTWRRMRRKWKWLESSTSTSTPQTTGSISILLLLLLLLRLRLRLRRFPERNRTVVWRLLFSVAPSPPASNSAGPCSSLFWLPTFRSIISLSLSLFKFVFVFVYVIWIGVVCVRFGSEELETVWLRI